MMYLFSRYVDSSHKLYCTYRGNEINQKNRDVLSTAQYVTHASISNLHHSNSERERYGRPRWL